MKLKNKQTGVIIEPDRVAIIKNTKETSTASFNRIAANYYSLAKLNEEWEDVEDINVTNTPLIKDEKIRKCVRLWAEINEFKGKLMYSKFDDCCSFYEADSQEELLFLNRECPNLKHAVEYTIAELCGEEDKDEA